MAITTLDGVIAGAKPLATITKVVSPTLTGLPASGKGYTIWYLAGNPSGSVATAIGINGEAVNAATTSATSIQGRIPRTEAISPAESYVTRFSAISSAVTGSLWLIDRLWHNSGLSATAVTTQSITAAALPPRDRNGSTNGDGVMAALEWSVAPGAGTGTSNLTYTDASSATANATIIGTGAMHAGAFEIFQTAPQPATTGTGVRTPLSVTHSATRTSGTLHLVLFRPILQIDLTVANIGNVVDALTSGMPEIYPYSCLQLVFFPTATTATTIFAQYVESQG